MKKILVAEDDIALNELVTQYLNASGYQAISALNGAIALKKFEEERPELIVSDIMMPELDGFALARQAREIDNKVPILFMSARDDKPSQQLGFKLGIDDYIVKPFDMDLLLLRIEAVLRRANINATNMLTVGNLNMDKDEHMAYLNGDEMPLTVREFDLLYKFLSYPKKTFTRSQLMDEFWDYDSSATSRTVDVYMAKLREKTAGCDGFEIVTVHGLGYKAVLK